ncbi:MAG TPA: nodulation protein NfeD [Anaerolineales bacterium]
MVRRISLWIWLFAIVLALASPPAQLAQAETAQAAPQVFVMTADGPLTPAMSGYLSRAIKTAENQGAEALIFQLNTPGGSLTLMNHMVEIIRASNVPVVVYVAPRGAMAGSAGTLITLAGHASAMAPETIIGAASPVDQSGQDLTQTMQAKEKNALEATAQTLAARRKPEAIALATQTIETAKAVSSQEALNVGLVDFIANDLNDLLRQLDGFTVQMNNGPRALHTANAVVVALPSTFIERLLSTLTDPNIVLILMNVGVVAILIELSNPGGWIAGFVGVVSLALSAYGLEILPVNWFGIVFLVLAFVLFILDIKAPTHGALTAAGVGSLIVGGLVLFNSPNVPTFQRVSIPVAVGSSLITGGLFFIILIFALRAQRVPVLTGRQTLIGKTGTALNDLAPRGLVRLAGEEWSAELVGGEGTAPKGSRVVVVKVEGLRLLVEKMG